MLNRWGRLAIYFGFWTLLGLLNAGSAVIEQLGDPSVRLWEPVVWEMSSLYTTGLLCPLIVRFVRRHAFTWENWHRLALGHLGGMVLFSLLHTTGMVNLRKLVYFFAGQQYGFSNGDLWLRLLYEFYKDIPLYWIIVLLSVGFSYYSKYRQQQLEASKLETRLLEAELENLKNQLNPHFLFNTLNMISSLTHEDPQRADEMIERLSELLRLALRHTSQTEIALREEVQALELYLDLMKARFDGQFKIRMMLDPESLAARVPSLILQPLVENAFRHGVATRTRGGALEISSQVEDEVLELVVRDNGPGISEPERATQKGIGLSNTIERLRYLYGRNQKVLLENIRPGEEPAPFQGGGFQVLLRLPLRKEEEER